ncbi:flagellar basal body P-ring formation chaperone FlgA [Neptuniibacter sp. 1_MG-2023]|uniref:flagellar basal body P-ring formation chaperone FlgA n=1 Tax=Neptuniibacter sp. 1_MG-2023 TaxID=3062662 RepID=UPI0026E20BF3|nr:flagellar basal body P-ring formation chaperone FlgA [Neptuniibacter sp. 1_MG-2023]MDO6595087.1 flagellar basal body P-ring formation chaperone FlgA [Neptuniibacter sp. 1_MG-2023]
MNTYNLTRLFLLTTFLLSPLQLFAAGEAEKLEQSAEHYLYEHYSNIGTGTRVEIKLNPISRKIKLKTCLAPYEFQTPKGSGSRITLKARCPSPLWQLFITAEVKEFDIAVVAQSSLARGTYISMQDIKLKEVEITSLRSVYFTKLQDIIGWTSKRSIAADTVITTSMLKAPLAVSKGDALIIEAKLNGVSIRTSGTALESGTLGEQIKVRNDRSGVMVKAKIIQAGLVQVP